MGANQAHGHQAGGGLFATCCSTPHQNELEIAGKPPMPGTYNNRFEGMRNLLEAEEEGKNVLLEAKKRRYALLETARIEALAEAEEFEERYRNNYAKEEAEVNKFVSKYGSKVEAQYEDEIRRELKHANKMGGKAAQFLAKHALHVHLELTVNACESLRNLSSVTVTSDSSTAVPADNGHVPKARRKSSDLRARAAPMYNDHLSGGGGPKHKTTSKAPPPIVDDAKQRRRRKSSHSSSNSVF